MVSYSLACFSFFNHLPKWWIGLSHSVVKLFLLCVSKSVLRWPLVVKVHTICGWNKLKTFPFISVGKHEFEKSWNEKTQDTTAYFKTHFFKVLKNPGYCGGTNYNVAGMSYSIYEHIKQKLHLLNCSSSLGASKNGFWFQRWAARNWISPL